MGDMIPCRACGHYHHACEQEMETLRTELAEAQEYLNRMIRLYESKWSDEPPELISARIAAAQRDRP